MEKGFKNITNLVSSPQADRIKQIEEKLKYIADVKTNQVKEQRANAINLRVSTIEKQSAELIRRIQSQSREQREALRELNREYEESSSKQQLSLRNRISEINQLQSRFSNLLKVELQTSKQSEKKAIAAYEQRIESLRSALLKEIEKRKEYFLALDGALSQKLPSLQAQVAEKMQQSGETLKKLQTQIQTETQRICKQIQSSQAKNLQSFEELMKMMSSVIAEIKEEINTQKQSRQESKKKLLTLFEGACAKFSY